MDISGRGLAEREIIDLIIGLQERMRGSPLPFGDDVAAVRLGGGRLAVLKCDMLVAATDVPAGMSLWQASRKAVVSGVSDFAAKGVEPKAIMVSLGLPRGLGRDDIRQIGSGLNSAAREYGAYIIGGDTNEAEGLTIDICLFGVCEEGRLVRRDTARVGDIVAVTGSFGLPALGLRIIKEGLEVPASLRVKAFEAVYEPKARLTEGVTLAHSRLLTSSIDSSDGLAWSLYELARASGVGFEIDRLPVDGEVERFAVENNIDYLSLTLYGGEEYELVVTLNPKLFERARRRFPLTPIGRVTGESGRLILKVDGEVHFIEPKGYEHLKYSSIT
ncbi:MAG: thiamine-phosphate kinase [Candidatus Bathyarchaeia archaeon]